MKPLLQVAITVFLIAVLFAQAQMAGKWDDQRRGGRPAGKVECTW